MNNHLEENIINEEIENISILAETSNSEEENEERKEIEIVSDDGSTLNISGVSDTINIVTHDDNKPKNIVIPQERK